MAVNNTLVKRPQDTGITEYLSNGETVKLSPAMIKNYLVSGGGNVTNEEVMMFLSLCRFQHLNPFLREAYLIKYGDRSPATMVVSKDVFIKRAMRDPNFNGMEAGIIVFDSRTGDVTERQGTFYNRDEETLLGGWAKVYMKNIDVPFYESVSLEEYEGRTKEGKPNSQWATKGATMIRKVAQMHALREAFPDNLAGMYVQEEIIEAQGVQLDETPVSVPQANDSIQAEATTGETINPADALFG